MATRYQDDPRYADLFGAVFGRVVVTLTGFDNYYWNHQNGSPTDTGGFKADTFDDPYCPFIVYHSYSFETMTGAIIIRSKPIPNVEGWECFFESKSTDLTRTSWQGNHVLMKEHLTLALVADWLD